MRSNRISTRFLLIVFLLLGCRIAMAAGSAPPNWQLNLTIEVYTADLGKIATHNIGSPNSIKTIQVPAGAELELTLRTNNVGGNPGGDGISTDIWLDWPKRTQPGDLDYEDYSCVPEDPSDCLIWKKTMTADLAFPGKQGKGIYNFLGWVDRFDTVTEDDEIDNVLGPVTIKVLPIIMQMKEPLILKPPTTKKTMPSIKGRNEQVDASNKPIEPMKKEAKELDPELKSLEPGGGPD